MSPELSYYMTQLPHLNQPNQIIIGIVVLFVLYTVLLFWPDDNDDE